MDPIPFWIALNEIGLGIVHLKEVTMKSPIVLLQALIADATRLEPDVKGLERDLVTLEKRFEHEGYGFLAIALPSFCDAIVDGLATRQFSCPSGFSKANGQAIPKLFSGMLSKVFDPSSGLLKDPKLINFGVIKLLREILYLFKKTQLSDTSSMELDRKAKSEFFQNDDLIKPHIMRSDYVHHLEYVCRVLLPDLSVRDLASITCKHGPGAVSEGLKGNQKWSSLVDPILNYRFDTQLLGYDDISIQMRPFLHRNDLITDDVVVATALSFSDGASSCNARLVTVPKNSTSARTITVEPMLNQFVQQGLNIELRSSIERCPVLSQCLALTDQTENQKLALEGSLTDEWATIDLKSASDLLSVKLVEIVFGTHGIFLDAMLDCRTKKVECDGIARSISKFAGMGNALTFPVQSICFASLAIAAILYSQGKKPDYRNVKRAARHIRVYGDDIIIRKQYAHPVVNWLISAGLKVNTKKSFLEGNFKESCGVDAYLGVDITPIYLRYRPDDSSTDPNAIASLVSTSNQAWLRGLYSFSACLQNEVETRLRKRLPLVSKDSGALGWHTHRDYMTAHKWNHVLQRLETRASKLFSLKRRDVLDGYGALLKFFHVPLIGRTKGHLEKSSVRYHNKLRTCWFPTRVGFQPVERFIVGFADEGA
jgi:hypothetical protein